MPISNVLCAYFALILSLNFTSDLTAHPFIAVIGPSIQPTQQQPIVQLVQGFEPFTGRVTRNRVRIRVGADLNSSIVRELAHSALISVIGEENNFYLIKT